MQNWLLDCQYEDYIANLEEQLESKYKLDLAHDLYKLICEVSILLYAQSNTEEKNWLLSQKERMLAELEKMENKKTYVSELAIKKKQIEKSIRKIDEILNDTKLLTEEFKNRNNTLEETEKIFSLSDFSDILHQERKNFLKDLKNYSRLMEPLNYLKNKNDLKDQVELLQEINIGKNDEKKIGEIIISLQKRFLQAFCEEINKAQNKKQIVELIYKLRYYNLIPINKEQNVKDIKELADTIAKTEKMLITKACKFKVFNILSNDIKINFVLVSNLLNTKIIDLDEGFMELKKKDNKTILNIYEDNMIETSNEYDYIEDVNIKYNKKIKIFI